MAFMSAIIIQCTLAVCDIYSKYYCRDIYDSKPVIRLKKDSEMYDKIVQLLQQPTTEVSVC